MIEFIKSNKLLVATIILVVTGLVSYKIFFLSTDAAPPLSSATVDAASSPVSQNLLAVLANLRTIHLDNSIFSSQSFVSLTDFGTEIAKEPSGRDNPFAPYIGIANFSGASAGSASTSLLKLPIGKKK